MPKTAMDKFYIIQPHLFDAIPLTELVDSTTVSLRTLKRWVQQYKASGLAGLRPKQRSDKGIHYSIDAKLIAIAEALALKKPPITLAAIHRQVAQIAKRDQLAVPSYRVIRDVVKSLDPGLMKLAHEGSKAYNESYELIYRRDANAPNAIWQADHTPLDIVLLNEKGEGKKPWLTTIIDDYSRAICGYDLTFEHPSAMNTALALRQAIWRKENTQWQVCGIPTILYSDNGSDFKSDHISQVAADLKIQLKNSIPGRPQGRGRVERFFLTVNQLLLMNLPGYTPSGAVYELASLTLEAFVPLFETFIIEQYHHRTHSTIGTTPIKRWTGDGFLPQMPVSLAQLDLLLLTVVRPRKVRRDGIYFQNLRYIDPTLAAYVGEKVIIRYDPRDMTEVRVYHEDTFVCRAICQELAHEKVSLKEIIRARQQRKKELNRTIAERRSLLDTILTRPKTTAPKKVEAIDVTSEKSHGLKLYEND